MDQDSVEAYLRLSNPGRELLGGAVTYHEVDAAVPLIHKGQSVSGAYLVTRGRLRVFTYTPQGREATLYFIHAGETCVLALNCLFNDLRYPAWVESAEATRVAVIPGPTYRELFKAEPAVQNLTVATLSTLIFRLMGELEQIHACNLDQRLANFILSHTTADGTLAMTQQALAGHLGTSREVIARLMQGFAAQGLLSSRRGVITVHDSAGLAARVQPSVFSAQHPSVPEEAEV